MRNLIYELDRIELFDEYRCAVITRTNMLIGKRDDKDFDLQIKDKNYRIVREKSMIPERWISEVLKNVKEKGIKCFQELSL